MASFQAFSVKVSETTRPLGLFLLSNVYGRVAFSVEWDMFKSEGAIPFKVNPLWSPSRFSEIVSVLSRKHYLLLGNISEM